MDAAIEALPVIESASARTTLSVAWRRGCAEETRVSRARYVEQSGSSGGAGTYDAMGSCMTRSGWACDVHPRQAGRQGDKKTGERAHTHLSFRARRSRLLHNACHRGAGPLRARTAPVLRLTLPPRCEDRRPERVFQHERGGRERRTTRDGQQIRRGWGEVGWERGHSWGRAGEEEGRVRAGGGLAHALEVRERWRVKAGGFEPSRQRGRGKGGEEVVSGCGAGGG